MTRTRSRLRLPVSCSLSVCATVALFWFLGMLISVDPGGPVIPIVPRIEFSRLVPETPVVTKPPVRPPREKPRPPPDTPPIAFERNPGVIRGFGPSEHGLPDGFGEGEEGLPGRGDPTFTAKSSGSDRGAIPQLRVAPDYPEQAKARGIEGWITFRFNVAVDGSVRDVAIVDSEPPRLWDSATIRAVSNWKYQPAIKDGKAVEQVGVTVTYRYELER